MGLLFRGCITAAAGLLAGFFALLIVIARLGESDLAPDAEYYAVIVGLPFALAAVLVPFTQRPWPIRLGLLGVAVLAALAPIVWLCAGRFLG